MGVQSQARARSAENQSRSTMTPGIQQLQQEGFGPGQVRALGEFMQGLIDRTVQPIMERLDRIDQRLDRIDQRLDRVDQRLDRVDQRFEQANERFEHIDRQFAHVERRFAMTASQLENMQEDIRRLQRWTWMPYLVMGLAFAGLYFALFGIWLAIVRIAA